MESPFYFVPGYTGFCPELSHRIGKSYGDATRKILREIPTLKTRLSPTRWHRNSRKQNRAPCPMSYNEKIEVENDTPCKCPYPSVPDFIDGYTGYIPKNVCMCANEKNIEPIAPQHTSSHISMSCGDACPCYEQEYYPECYASCNKAGDNGGGSACGYWALHPKGVVHFPVPGGRQSKMESSTKACCGSCSKGGACEGDKMNRSRTSQTPLNRRFPRIMPHRQGGVIVNYTGHIPGMMFSHGETYGSTSRRLLNVHFDNMSRMGIQDRNYH